MSRPRSRTYTPSRPLIEAVEQRLHLSTSPPTSQVAAITARYETTPVSHGGDAADDIAIWAGGANSAIVATDKQGALNVYNLSGGFISSVTGGEYNGVDLRDGFSLGGQSVVLVGATNRSTNSIELYTLDPATRRLTDVTAGRIRLNVSGEIYGFTMYRSAAGKTYAFAVTKGGWVQQFELNDNGAGRVSATSVRTFDVGRQSEGMVADDANGWLFVGEEDVGIWRYNANPNGGSSRTQIGRVGRDNLRADVEGLALYQTSDGQGYLIASSQGNNSYVVYDRLSGQYITRFTIASGSIDGVSNTDGIEVFNGVVGDFNEGLFIAQDGSNSGSNQNFKLVSWGDIARAMAIDLVIDTGAGPTEPPPPPINAAPVVNAGADQSVNLAAGAVSLDGTLTDDGLPAAAGVSWSVITKPANATVTIADANAVDTTASFNVAGTYVFQLLADDTQYQAADQVMVTVANPTTPTDPVPPTDPAPPTNPPSDSINDFQLSAPTEGLAQHKLWQAHGRWWGVMAYDGDTWVCRLDGDTWTGVLRLTGDSSTRADVRPVGDGSVVHALLKVGSTLKLASFQYQSGTYTPWANRPNVVTIGSMSSMADASMEIDSTGRMWIAYDGSSSIYARYADGDYSDWSSAITIATRTSRDDMAAIVKLDGRIGIFWSNSRSERFGFRTHVDGSSPTAWTNDELPGASTALNTGGGLADDYMNVAVAPDGTLYVAVKTGYDSTRQTSVGLLVRRPGGQWDNTLYRVDTATARNPAVAIKGNTLYVLYTPGSGRGDVVYKTSPLDTIHFSDRQTAIDGSLEFISTSREATDELLVIAVDRSNQASSVFL